MTKNVRSLKINDFLKKVAFFSYFSISYMIFTPIFISFLETLQKQLLHCYLKVLNYCFLIIKLGSSWGSSGVAVGSSWVAGEQFKNQLQPVVFLMLIRGYYAG